MYKLISMFWKTSSIRFLLFKKRVKNVFSPFSWNLLHYVFEVSYLKAFCEKNWLLLWASFFRSKKKKKHWVNCLPIQQKFFCKHLLGKHKDIFHFKLKKNICLLLLFFYFFFFLICQKTCTSSLTPKFLCCIISKRSIYRTA